MKIQPHIDKILKNDKIIILGLIVIVMTFFAITKTPFSGYHFVDDHEIIRINHDLKDSGFSEVTKKWIAEDFSIRFRPLYYFLRVLKTNFFGSYLLFCSFYNIIIFILTLTFFYKGMRNLGFNSVESLLFLIVSFAGQQMAMWWRLGPNEPPGVTFLALSFYFMTKGRYVKNKLLNNLAFSFFLILSSLCKESFIVIIPGMIVTKLLIETEFKIKSLKKVLVNNISLILPILILIVELYFILSAFNSKDVIYEGYESQSFIEKIYTSLINTTHYTFNKGFQIFTLVVTLFIVFAIYKKKYKWQTIIPALLFCISIFIPNLYLYSKTGLWERYLIPSTIGLAFLLIYVVFEIKNNYKMVYRFSIIFLMIISLPAIGRSYFDAKRFYTEGKNLNNLINSLVENNTDDSNILVVADPVDYYEQSFSLKQYLSIEHKLNIYGYATNQNNKNQQYEGLVKGWYRYFENKTFDKMEGAPNLIVILDKDLTNHFFDTTKIEKRKYSNVIDDNPEYALYLFNN